MSFVAKPKHPMKNTSSKETMFENWATPADLCMVQNSAFCRWGQRRHESTWDTASSTLPRVLLTGTNIICICLSCLFSLWVCSLSCPGNANIQNLHQGPRLPLCSGLNVHKPIKNCQAVSFDFGQECRLSCANWVWSTKNYQMKGSELFSMMTQNVNYHLRKWQLNENKFWNWSIKTVSLSCS